MDIPSGVNIDFYPVLDIRTEDLGKVYRIILADSTIHRLTKSYEIVSLSLHLMAPNLDTPLELDLIPYIRQRREDREWFIINSDVLGLPEGNPIPDGVYIANITVNNAYTRKHTFFVFNDIETDIRKLLSSKGFYVDVNQLNLEYQNSDKYDFERFAILVTLLEAIKTNALDGNAQAAEAAMVKAQRVLKTIQI